MMPFLPWTRAQPALPHSAALTARTALAALAAGEASAIGPLYRAEAPRVYRYALALCSNPAWAADATQEAFVALALRPQGFDASKGTLGAYLAGVARHALAAQWRTLRSEEPLRDDAAEFEGQLQGQLQGQLDVQAAAPSPEALLVQAQDTAAIWAALRQLPAIFREALVLVDLQERPYAEAAAIAGIELNTLRTRLHRARCKLAALLRAGQESTA